ncbi:MAG: UbiA-like polyprenyltransferase [Anaerolineales bacterium]|nr:putative 4-hydroxybenzoate polyprenyltransferase [Anaerolineales bacterium]MCS7247637.1 putative 4-hydroxybenzoate polyprenyltransferase [Anaerolineales bacterium]MDW8161447.1 UbiA-like polyprenyltransferase [Anaerolineales bacterium]MDW8445955.1 UbiA-like polyprenyltransferase [Anaerolineales bacterium]
MKPLRNFLELIKFEHTVFALPFAYLGMILAAGGFPTWRQFLWITIAMTAARTIAMGFNRIVDREIDARNPRTAARPLVSGRISLGTAWTGTILATVLLAVAAWQLGPLPLTLLPGALVLLFGYSYTKRFTWLSHYILGITDGLAPLGAWVAVRGSLLSSEDAPAWLLFLVVTFWIGGFDLIYACQDVEVDRRENLKSIPARFGISFALSLSSLSHLVCFLLLVALGLMQRFTLPFWVGLAIIGALFVWEHRLVKPHDLTRVDLAFFNINSYISLTLFFAVVGALWLR